MAIREFVHPKDYKPHHKEHELRGLLVSANEVEFPEVTDDGSFLLNKGTDFILVPDNVVRPTVRNGKRLTSKECWFPHHHHKIHHFIPKGTKFIFEDNEAGIQHFASVGNTVCTIRIRGESEIIVHTCSEMILAKETETIKIQVVINSSSKLLNCPQLYQDLKTSLDQYFQAQSKAVQLALAISASNGTNNFNVFQESAPNGQIALPVFVHDPDDDSFDATQKLILKRINMTVGNNVFAFPFKPDPDSVTMDLVNYLYSAM